MGSAAEAKNPLKTCKFCVNTAIYYTTVIENISMKLSEKYLKDILRKRPIGSQHRLRRRAKHIRTLVDFHYKARVHCFSTWVVMIKCILLNPEKILA